MLIEHLLILLILSCGVATCWYVAIHRDGINDFTIITWGLPKVAFTKLQQFILRIASLPLTRNPHTSPTSENRAALSTQHGYRCRCRWQHLACDQIGRGGEEIWFHASLFLQTFSLCWVITFKTKLSQLHLFPLLSSTFSDLLRPCNDAGPRSRVGLRDLRGSLWWSPWLAAVPRHFRSSPLLLSFL